MDKLIGLIPTEAIVSMVVVAIGLATAWMKKLISDIKNTHSQSLEGVAVAIGNTIHLEIESALENRHHTRNSQIDVTRSLLYDYACTVTRTAGIAIDGMVCQSSCNTRESLVALYADAVINTFLTDVLNYFITNVISKNGFASKNDEELSEMIDDVRRKSFSVFLGSMRRRFRQEQIQIRVDWIEKNTDTAFMRQLISSIIYGCKEIATDYNRKNVERAKGIPERILSNIPK